ncbi:MAG: flavin reductase family protein [Planctomycetota bacterium]
MDHSIEAIGPAVGRIPSGCSILTVTHQDQQTGVLVSWVQQASFEPLTLTVCVKQGRPAGTLIDAAGKFLLNVIGDDPGPMFKHFGRGFALGEDAFDGVNHDATEFGPRIADCIAHIGCKVISKTPAGDHDVYIAEAVAGDGGTDQKPYVHLRKTGYSY